MKIKVFTFSFNQNTINFDVNIPLPRCVGIREMSFRIINKHKIPFEFHDRLIDSFINFVEKETDDYENSCFIEAQENSHKSEIDVKSEFEMIINKAKNSSIDKIKKKNDHNLEFADIYNNLVHSGHLTELIVSLEHSYSFAVDELIESRDESLSKLNNCQAEEMENTICRVGFTIKDEDVNKLSVKHFQESEENLNKWNQMITQLKLSQKEKFSEIIKSVYACYESGEKEAIIYGLREQIEANITQSKKQTIELLDWEKIDSKELINMEESFTINLGSQLKTSHNLRLVSMNVLQLCSEGMKSISPTPQRIQTAMSLYSDSLNAIVLLVDNRVNSYSGIKKQFANICSKSTDFHFPTLEEQLEKIRYLNGEPDGDSCNKNSTIKTGDFYITKHSNLSQIHIVFHLVTDDQIYSSDLNSRYPLLAGLRNILKIAYIYDIKTLSLPLLLIQELSEEITMQWCIKRAELVLKCVKGFMIEMASLSPGSDDNKTLQFIVPKGISEELFSSLALMVSGIFRLSNPLILKSQE